MKHFLSNIKYFQKSWLVILVIIIITTVASIIKIEIGVKGDGYTHYNNYIIFKNSFLNLFDNKDLYVAHPEKQWDLYKYSPTFALLMGPFTIFSNGVGLILWNLFNSLALALAILTLPIKKEAVKSYILWFILIELITSIQNAQSNGIMAASMIMAYNCFERNNNFLASLLIVLSVHVKLFGIVCAVLFILYPKRVRFILYSIFWVIILGLLPLIVITPDQLLYLYKSWTYLLVNDFSASTGLSVMGFLKSWFNLDVSKDIIVAIGLLILLLPLLHYRNNNDLQFRLFFIASILIWVIIFNHKAESPTFIIAISGTAIWYFSQVRQVDNLILLWLVFILTSITPTDIFPKYLRETFVTPYVFKAVPCIFIWVKLSYQLIFLRYKSAIA